MIASLCWVKLQTVVNHCVFFFLFTCLNKNKKGKGKERYLAKNNYCMFSFAVCLTQQVVGLCHMLFCDFARWLLDSKTSQSLCSHLVATILLYVYIICYLSADIVFLVGGIKVIKSHFFSGCTGSYANDNGEKTALIRGLLKKLYSHKKSYFVFSVIKYDHSLFLLNANI